jgi:limonene 1,2-monooxygenase
VNEAGIGAIGTVEDAAAQVQRLVGPVRRRFGAMLLLAHEWANPQATRRSYELIAQHVMPRSRARPRPPWDARERARGTRTDHAASQNAAVAHMTEKYQKELADRG